MERFKAMEKELKMKTYSQAGLNAVSKVVIYLMVDGSRGAPER